LQLFGGVILVYFVIKKLNQADFWQILPSPASLEMSLATLAFLLLIGATGNIHSPLFPLTFVHLFFLTLSAANITTLIVLFEIVLFHYSLSSGVGTIELSYLASLPIVTGFFLLAKDQFVKVFKQKASIAQVVNISKTVDTIRELQRVDRVLENLLANLINPQVAISTDEADFDSPYAPSVSATNFESNTQAEQPEFVSVPLEEPITEIDDAQSEFELVLPRPKPQSTVPKIPISSISPELQATSERVANEILEDVSQPNQDHV
jgi:hypothetical protein